MLEFKKITIDDKSTFDKYLCQKQYFLCDLCFVDLFVWGGQYNAQYATADGYIFVCFGNDKDIKFLPPLGDGDLKVAIDSLIEYTKSKNITLTMAAVPTEIKEKIEDIFGQDFEINEVRDKFNYIYNAESLISLKGKKLHSKRNHINKFMSVNEGKWSYEELTDENTREFFSYHLDWCKENEGEFLGETCAISVALKNREALGLKGGILRLEGKIIAVTLGSKICCDTFIVHFEKADGAIQGAYQMINQQFAIHSFEGIRYVNREEDLGIEGLRKAKLSYYPEFLAESYTCNYIK